MRLVAARAAAMSPPPSWRPVIACAGDRDRVEGEDEQVPDPHGHLMGGDGGVRLPGRDRGHQHQDGLERKRPQHQRGAGERRRLMPWRSGRRPIPAARAPRATTTR